MSIASYSITKPHPVDSAASAPMVVTEPYDIHMTACGRGGANVLPIRPFGQLPPWTRGT